MSEGTDPYAVLGLTPVASQEQIRHAYRALLRQTHPDTGPSGDPSEKAASSATFQKVLAAYAILGDPAGRTRYDHRTSPRLTRTTTRVGPAVPYPNNGPDQPPIQAGPVRWHASRR